MANANPAKIIFEKDLAPVQYDINLNKLTRSALLN